MSLGYPIISHVDTFVITLVQSDDRTVKIPGNESSKHDNFSQSEQHLSLELLRLEKYPA